MRTKSFTVRASRKSLDSSPSLPVEQLRSRVISTESEAASDDHDADGEKVPDTYDDDEGRRIDKHHCLGATSETTLGGGRVDLEACIVCDVSDVRVNRCNGTGCILSFHTECVDTDAESENPYCPYCWFKIVSLKTKSLREEASVAEKEVSKYLSKETKSRDGENCNHEPMDICSFEDEQVEAVNDSRRENIPLEVGTNEPEDEERSLQDSEDDETANVNEDGNYERRVDVGNDSGQTIRENIQLVEYRGGLIDKPEDEERNLHDFEDDEIANVDKDAGEKRGVSSFLSIQDLLSEQEKNEKQNSRKRRLILNDADSELSTNKGNGEEFTDLITSSTQVTAATTKVAKSKPGREVEFFKKDQRRRLFWTVEEEEKLKLGVEKFAEEANKNMPWRKILEWGEKVFHETRAPADLKDKWRNMCRKAT